MTIDAPTLDARLRRPHRADRGAAGTQHKFDMKLVNPDNKRKFEVIVVGTGLAGASAAASLAQLGYKVKVFTFHDSPRRAHSIAAQGGINAAKNYPNDGDSIYRLFYDTVKGGDFRARESNVYRLAQVSVEHHRPVRGPGRALRPRVRRPARQPLVRRRPGEPHVLRPGPDRPAAPARRLPGPRGAGRRWAPSRMYTKTEMLDVVVKDGKALRHRHPRPGQPARSARTRPTPCVLATGGYSQRLLPVDQRHELQRHRGVAGAHARARCSPTRASRRSTRPASRRATSSSRSSR